MPIRIDQNRYYDFLCVDDLIKIVQWFIDNKPKHKVYNICTGRVIDFETIAKKIVKISGKNLNIEIKTEGLASEYSGDNSMLTSEIKKFKFGSIDEQIKNLYSWYDLNKNIIKKNEL
jgi:GDP-L-fucose synthase